jgi:SPP1 gp7 family putative phage head morphogenesis protein
VKPSDAQRILSANLLDPAQMPSMAGRTCETWVKRRLFRLEDRAVREQAVAYEAALADLQAAAERVTGYEPPVRAQRPASLVAWRDVVGRLLDTTARIAAQAAQDGYTLGYYGRAWLLDMVTAPDVRVSVTGGQAAEDLPRIFEAGGRKPWRWGGDLWSLLGRQWQEQYALEMDELIVRMQRALTAGMRAGEGMRPIMRRVANEMGVVTDRRLGPVGSAERAGYRANFNRVQTITRTAVQQSANQGAARVFYDNRELLAGYRHLTARDERVCSICAAMDGTLYAVGEWALPPSNTHPNCRCTITPELRADYADIYLNDPPRETFNEWSALLGFTTGALLGMAF